MAFDLVRRAGCGAPRRGGRRFAAALASVLALGSLAFVVSPAAGATAATGVSVLPVLESNYVGVVETLDTYAEAVQGCPAAGDESACFVDAGAVAIHSVAVLATRVAAIGVPAFAKGRVRALHASEQLLGQHLRSMAAYADDPERSQVARLVSTVLPATGAFEVRYFAAADALSLEIYRAATPIERGTALRAAVVVGLQGSDLPADESSTDDAIYYTAPSAAGICTPVSSQPFLADVVSDDFVTESTDDYSAIFVMPTISYARTAVRGIALPAYDTDCYVPAVEGTLLSLVKRSDGCVSPTVLGTVGTVLPGAGIATDPVIDRASVTLRCGASKVVATSDLITQAVGPFVVQGSFASVGTVPSQAEEASVFAAMTARAAATHTV